MMRGFEGHGEPAEVAESEGDPERRAAWGCVGMDWGSQVRKMTLSGMQNTLLVEELQELHLDRCQDVQRKDFAKAK